MNCWLRKEEWPWWQAGLLLGLLNMAAFYRGGLLPVGFDDFLARGGNGGWTRRTGACGGKRLLAEVKPIVDWQFMLVLGIPLGAYLAARLTQKSYRVHRIASRYVG